MTFRLICLVAVLFSLTACAVIKPVHLPKLIPAHQPPENPICAQPFPTGNWQFVHSITFAMNSGAGSTVIGVTTLKGTTIESGLITLEGMTLFDAEYKDNRIEVKRAVPPFDKPGFARGLLNDVRAIFLPPAGSVQFGKTTSEASICRYTAKNEAVTDILFTDDCWQLMNYTTGQLPERSIVGSACSRKGEFLLPGHLKLTASGPSGYSLDMTLIRADKLGDSLQ